MKVVTHGRLQRGYAQNFYSDLLVKSLHTEVVIKLCRDSCDC